jgi:hypothetical protein
MFNANATAKDNYGVKAVGYQLLMQAYTFQAIQL